MGTPSVSRHAVAKTPADNANATPIERTIGRRVAALRREVGLTLREFGEKTGLSDAYLSRVENGHTALTIASLARIAEVFATPLTSFFEEEEQPHPIVFRRSGTGQKVRFRGRRGTLVTLLADEKHSKLMEPLIVDVASAPKDVPLRSHAGEEFNYVIEGRCRLLFGREQYVLSPGDAVYFDATIDHALHAIEREPCRILAVVSSRDFQFHRNISKVVEGRIQA
ncbi:MAG: XRE family transcriptional regulator [Opitutaceae bacterium]|nr:XRE family transcriptional regulator [Opitutaceae bacterium]